ncbi:MAG: hypothetical protein U5N58_10265 [Actinomycetota bacterium]|nr:hypothetical protein [Actinomycetota bacterium]
MGHAGTLDPLAQGLIIILINRATKLSQFFLTMDKEYRATIKLGIETDTWDNEGRVVSRSTPAIYKQKELERILESYVGTNYQEPPMYSAIKYKGRPLYSYARKGKKVEMKKKENKYLFHEAAGLFTG